MYRKRGYFVVFGIILLFLAGVAYSATFSDISQGDFNNGTYANTLHNGSALTLSGQNFSGNFTSQIFDAGAASNWSNVTISKNVSNFLSLFAVDNQADIYKSEDSGVNWGLIKDDYTGPDGNNADYMTSNSTGGLFILFNQDVWSSENEGLNWTKISDDFNPSDSNNGLVMDANNNGSLFIADGSGDVFMSVDSGNNWTSRGDFNGGASNNALGIVVNSSDAIYIVDGSGSVWLSIDSGTSWTEQNDSYGGGSGTDDMDADSQGNLYILFNKDIYKSTNAGVSWNIVNDSFTSHGSDGRNIMGDEFGNLYVIDGQGRVFQSTNAGVSWSEVGDYNGGLTTNVQGFTSYLYESNLSFQVRNCSLSDCSGASFVGPDGTGDSFFVDDFSAFDYQSRYFQYLVFLNSESLNLTPQLFNVSIGYKLLASEPVVNIISPSQGASLGFNESINLNFTIVNSTSPLDSCWYSLDSGINNITLANCQNSTFNVSGDGAYSVTVYANESISSLEGFDSVNFSVQVGAPSISLSHPLDVYLASGNNIQFNYTATDIDLNSCSLWGDFNGTFSSNQTDNSVVSGVQDIFILNLSDGSYNWNVACNDSQGNLAFNGNQSFSVDTLNPALILTEPNGSKTSTSDIPLTFSVVDASPTSCIYNVFQGASPDIANTSVDCSSGSTSFSVSSDGNYILNFYVNDSAGNTNFSNTSFSVTTSSGGGSGSSGSSSSGGGGGGGSSIIRLRGELDIGNISNFVALPGENKKISLSVKNSGISFLNDCHINSLGDNRDWISNDESVTLGGGENHDFVVSLNVPEGLETGSYLLELEVECDEFTKGIDFSVEILEKQIGFSLIEAKRIDSGEVSVIYTLQELSGIDQEIELQFLLYDILNEKVAEITDTKFLAANDGENFEAIIDLDGDLEGDFSLLVNINSETYSTFVQENIVLSSRVSGFAIFGDGENANIVISSVFIISFIVFTLYMGMRIFKARRNSVRTMDFSDIDKWPFKHRDRLRGYAVE